MLKLVKVLLKVWKNFNGEWSSLIPLVIKAIMVLLINLLSKNKNIKVHISIKVK